MTTTPQAALLSDDEIERHFENNKSVPGRELRRLIGRSIEAAILAKLQSTQTGPVQAAELPDERDAFEKWASDNGEFPRAVARSGDVYHLMATQTYWLAWQARAALSARKPLTDEQRGKAYREVRDRLKLQMDYQSFSLGCDCTERAHGIGLEVKP